MATNPSPSPKNNMWDLIAFYLRALRNDRGLSGEATGRIIRASKSSVSRIENGEDRLDGKQAGLLDKAWNLHGLFGLLVWYASLGHDPEWFQQFVRLEQRAVAIRTFTAQIIHGLLQTEEYARALISLADGVALEESLKERMERQRILFDKEPRTFLIAVISQDALEWPLGSPELMRDQLARLLELSEHPNVVIRVVPRTFETGAYLGLDGSFTLISGDDFGDVAYTESPQGGRLVSTPAEVRSFAIRYDRIGAKALPEEPSRALIHRVMEAFNEQAG